MGFLAWKSAAPNMQRDRRANQPASQASLTDHECGHTLNHMSRTTTYYAYFFSYGYRTAGRGWRRTRD